MATRMHAISAYQRRRQPELSGNPRRFAQGLAQLGPHGAPLDESCDPVDGPRDVLEASSYRMVVSSGRVFDRSVNWSSRPAASLGQPAGAKLTSLRSLVISLITAVP